MSTESDTVRQHPLFSDYKRFEVQLDKDLHSSLLRPDNYAGIFFTLMGYLTTMQKTEIHDQIEGELITTSNLLTSGYDYSRFFVLFIAKTTSSKFLTGRLFYFHLNENALLLYNHFSKADVDVLYRYTRSLDPEFSETSHSGWIQHIVNNCLCIRLKKGRHVDGKWISEGFHVDATFYRMINLFQNGHQLTNSWREWQTSDLTMKFRSSLFSQSSTEIYNALLTAFTCNIHIESYPNTVDLQYEFAVFKENFLNFVRGALQYNAKMFHQIKIVPQRIGLHLEKLSVLEHDRKKWVTDLPPIICTVIQSSDTSSDSQSITTIDDLPIDFLTNSKTAIVDSIVFYGSNIKKAVSKKVNIGVKSDLIHYLNKILCLENDKFHENFSEIRKQIMLQMDKIDAFLGHEHRTDVLRHFIFGSILSKGREYKAFKLKSKFSELNPVDLFLLKSSESSGIVVALSKNIMDIPAADSIADSLLQTGLRKLLVLTVNDQPYDYVLQADNTMRPFIGMQLIEDSTPNNEPSFDPSHWAFISPLFLDHYFKMLVNTVDHQLQTSTLQNELTYHDMNPTNQKQFEAQIKGFVAGKDIFTPYGLDGWFMGIKIESDLHLPPEYGDARRPFHVIMQLSPSRHNTELNHLKTFFKKQLSFSGSEKLNTALIRPRLFRDLNDNRAKYEFHGSFPNGIDAHEYEECLPRQRRAGSQKCLSIEENDAQEVEDSEKNARKVENAESNLKITKLVNKAIYFQMIKGVVGSALDSDFSRMAKEGGILAGMFAVGTAGEVAAQWGQNLMYKNSLAGGSVYLGGKLLSKVYLGFVIADVIARSKAYQMGDEDQLMGIVGDSAILTINSVPLTLEIFSTFASVEQASVELGPEVMLGEAVIFALIDGYYAVKSVKKIGKHLQLSWGESFVQWTRAFFSAHTSDYLEHLIREKELLVMAVDEAARKLRLQNGTFTFIATPTLTVDRKGKIVQEEDNTIDMTSWSRVWSRTWPTTKQNLRVECASGGYEKQDSMMSLPRKLSDYLGLTNDGTVYKSYVCENMIALSRKNFAPDDMALTILGYGTDNAKGFSDRKNYFIIGGGEKRVSGGKLADTFHLIGNDAVYGIIDGGEDGNTLDLSQFMLSTELAMDLTNDTLKYPTNIETVVKGIENVSGRNDVVDRVICSCRTNYLDLKGGKSDLESDIILIPSLPCTSGITVKLSGYMTIDNRSNKTKFIYLVTNNTRANITNQFHSIEDLLLLPMNLSSIDLIENASFENVTSTTIESKINSVKLTLNGNQEGINFISADGYQISYFDSAFHAKREVENFSTILKEDLLVLSNRLEITLTIFSEVNKELMQVHNRKKPIDPNENGITHFINDPNYKSNIITTNYRNNYFQINALCNENIGTGKCFMKNISIYIISIDDTHSNTIDLSQIRESLLHYNKKLDVEVRNVAYKFYIDLKDEGDVFGSIDIQYDSETNKKTCTQLFVYLNTLKNVCYDSRSSSYALFPAPSSMNDGESVLIFSHIDVEKNMTIKINRQAPNFVCQSYKDSLILTNSITERNSKDEFTLIFVDYFSLPLNLLDNHEEELFNSMIFEFEDRNTRETKTIQEFINNCAFMIQKI